MYSTHDKRCSHDGWNGETDTNATRQPNTESRSKGRCDGKHALNQQVNKESWSPPHANVVVKDDSQSKWH